ncbi:MAG: RnfABCDGE type electron transport complex subunit D [Lentisphaerae bacterium]|nr:RnfABCDGE type electron transport complex subunit D [Lentisphaerota bacterium]
MDTEKNSVEMKLPTGKNLVLSSSPHLSTGANLRKIMGGVLLALLPSAAAAVWFFGWRALLIIVYTAFCCVTAEALWCAFSGKPVWRTIGDLSAALTGVLLAFCLPVSVPLYVPPIGAILAIWLGKQVYGGLGNNPFNPALVARVGLLIALPAAMTFWTPSRGMMKDDYPEKREFFSQEGLQKISDGEAPDAVTCATPLGVAGTTPKVSGRSDEAAANFISLENRELFKKYFIGDRAGCLGETSVLALIMGYFILVALNLINWRVPLLFIGTVALVTALVNWCMPGVTPPALFHILNGGLFLGAVFMATDMVTSPITGLGCVIFAVGCGLLTSVIRIWGNYPEGVSFAILFMNALVPLIDRWCGHRPFGYVPIRKKEVSK